MLMIRIQEASTEYSPLTASLHHVGLFNPNSVLRGVTEKVTQQFESFRYQRPSGYLVSKVHGGKMRNYINPSSF
jgi:hypothetical protein